MLGFEHTNIMLRSERSTHQPALTQLVIYVPNLKLPARGKACNDLPAAKMHPSIPQYPLTTSLQTAALQNTSFHMPTVSKGRNKTNSYPG